MRAKKKTEEVPSIETKKKNDDHLELVVNRIKINYSNNRRNKGRKKKKETHRWEKILCGKLFC